MTANFIPPVMLPLIWLIVVITGTAGGHNPVVSTDKGLVRGQRIHLGHSLQVDAFYGIPYAKPPIDDLRFRHPLPVDEWSDIYDATRLPNACMQLNDTTFPGFKGADVWNPNTPASEDCLYLNVWVPTKSPSQNKAVMVWIYGGSYSFGSIALDVYNAKYLAAENDIIVVSMQYRLGSLGFLSFNDPEAPGNAGLFDQLKALEWVQTNIHNFGGNSHNVTLFGESVGAASIGIHMLSPLSTGKFHRAILQSGAPQAPWATVTKTEAVRRATELAKAFDCPISDVKLTINCLRSKNASEFPTKDFHHTIAVGITQFPFVAVIDGVLLPESPVMAFNNKHFKKTSILIGTNVNEGSYFLPYWNKDLFPLNEKAFLSHDQFRNCIENFFSYYPQYPKKLNSIGTDAISFQYTPWKNPYDQALNREAIDQAVGDQNFVCPTIKFAEQYSLVGLPVYQYRFEHRTFNHYWPEWIGVMHGEEISYVFGEPMDPRKNYTRNEKKLSKKVMKYWSNFAKTGDPNKEPGELLLNEWPLYTIEERKYLKINQDMLHEQKNGNIENTIGIGPRLHDCAFWDHYLPHLVQATADTSEVEKQWKLKFADWTTHFDNFILTYEHRLQACSNVSP